MLLDIAHTNERCDENQFPFYYKISSEFIAEVLNASQNKAAIQKAIEENRCTYFCEHCRIEKKSREALNSHLNENTCMCGYVGICEESDQFKQLHSQIHKEFEANEKRNKDRKNDRKAHIQTNHENDPKEAGPGTSDIVENSTDEKEDQYECKGSPQHEQIHEVEANEKFKRFEKILEEKRALITEKLKQVQLNKQLEEEDVVNNVRDTIQKEIRELKEFTEAYEKIKASHTKEIELMKNDSVKQREDMTKIENINLHLTNEINSKNDANLVPKSCPWPGQNASEPGLKSGPFFDQEKLPKPTGNWSPNGPPKLCRSALQSALGPPRAPKHGQVLNRNPK